MPEMSGYALPVYEGVVCGLVLEKMRREESQHEPEELLGQLFTAEAKTKELIQLFADSTNFSTVSRDEIGLVAGGLVVLSTIMRRVSLWLREKMASSADEKYRAALATIGNEIAGSQEKLEEIREAWVMALDQTCVGEIKEALAQSSKERRERGEPGDWRDVLASIQD